MLRLFLYCFLLWAMPGGASSAVDIPPLPKDLQGTGELIDRLQATVEQDPDLADEPRQRVLATLQEARQTLTTIRGHEDAARAFKEAGDRAPKEVIELEKEIAEVERTPALGKRETAADPSLAELEQAFAQARAELGAAEARLSDLDAQRQSALARPEAARQRIAQLKQVQQELGTQLAAAAPAPEDLRARARRFAQELQARAVTAELKALEQELLTHNVRLRALDLRRTLAQKSLTRLSARARGLSEILNQRRLSAAEEAEKVATETEREAADKHPGVRALAESNAELTRSLSALTAELEGIAGATNSAGTQSRQITETSQRIRERLEVAGFTDALGRVLIEERRGLPRREDYHSALQERRRQVAKLGQIRDQLEQERDDLNDLEAATERHLARFSATPGEVTDPARLKDEVRKLLQDRRKLLEQAVATYGNYLRALGDLDFAQRELLGVAEAYGAFLDQHLLWTPSARPVGLHTLGYLATSAAWVLDSAHWRDLGTTLAEEAVRRAPMTLAVGILFAVLVWARRPMDRRQAELARGTRRLSTDHIGLTLQALALAPVQALPVPLLLAGGGLLLTGASNSSPFVAGSGGALLVLAQMLFNLFVFQRVCAREGVAERHFHWSPETLALLRRELNRLVAVLPAPVFLAVTAAASGQPDISEGLARLMFLVVLATLAGFFYTVFHPQRGVAAVYIADHPRSFVARTRYLTFAATVAAPLLFAGLALFGFSYTAVQLSQHFVDTLWLLTSIIIVNDLAVRAIALSQRKIALRRALEKREAARQARAEAGEGTAPIQDSEIPVVEEHEIDLEAVDSQSRKLLHTVLFLAGALGLWVIWSSVVPAFGILDSVSLWNQTEILDGKVALQPITLGDLVLALVVLVLTIVGARNIPGVLELGLLQRIDMTPGGRYATATLTRYAIVAVGISAGFSVIGGSWSQIQWLVAALGVGLGFGLQEIFGNFASGLFILFERPIRVGDTVTVGDLTGRVTRIRFRATTITDWDRKEIIVPNKAFITERVINWTLSDPITRLVIPVGIAYGSDTVKAHKVMTATLAHLPLVLDDPAPMVYFDGFGDSSLDFKLYVYARQLEDRLPLRHEVHMAVLRALEEAGVTIPFPQRDVHVKGWPPVPPGGPSPAPT